MPTETPAPAAASRANRSDSEDLELFRRARTGDFSAFEQLVDRFQPRVFGLAQRILGNSHDAEDVTQQTFVSMIEHLDQFREESSVAAWIFRIAANHALKLIRKRRGLPTVTVDAEPDDPESYASVPHPEFIAPWREDPALLVQRNELRGLLDEAISELDEKHRIVFILRDVEGLSVRETAEALGLTEANVKVRSLRARMHLRERLTRMFGDESRRLVPDHHH